MEFDFKSAAVSPHRQSGFRGRFLNWMNLILFLADPAFRGDQSAGKEHQISFAGIAVKSLIDAHDGVGNGMETVFPELLKKGGVQKTDVHDGSFLRKNLLLRKNICL